MKHTRLKTAQKRLVCVVSKPADQDRIIISLRNGGYGISTPKSGWTNVHDAFLIEVKRIINNCGVVANVFTDSNYVSEKEKLLGPQIHVYEN